jgi:NAD(P)H-hydrate epimerase
MIGAFLAQGCKAPEAAIAAVYIHGLCADEVKKQSGEIGMMATDLLQFIPRLVNSFAGAIL